MAKEKVTISIWEGISSQTKANTGEEMNTGCSFSSGFDILEDSRKLTPVGEMLNWTAENDLQIKVKGVGSISDRVFFTGNKCTNWIDGSLGGNTWQNRIKITPSVISQNDCDNFVLQLASLPASFWATNPTLESLRVTKSDGSSFVKSYNQSLNINTSTGTIIFENVGEPFYYLYFGNINAINIPITSSAYAMDFGGLCWLWGNTGSSTPGFTQVSSQYYNSAAWNTDRFIGSGVTPNTKPNPSFISNGITNFGYTTNNNSQPPQNIPSNTFTINFLISVQTGGNINLLEGWGAAYSVNTAGVFSIRCTNGFFFQLPVGSPGVGLTMITCSYSSATQLMQVYRNGVLQQTVSSNNMTSVDDSNAQFLPSSSGDAVMDYLQIKVGSQWSPTKVLNTYNMIASNNTFYTFDAIENQSSVERIYTEADTSLYYKDFGDTGGLRHFVTPVPLSVTDYSPTYTPITASSTNTNIFFIVSDSQVEPYFGNIGYFYNANNTSSPINPVSIFNFNQTTVEPRISTVEGIDSADYFTSGSSSIHKLGSTGSFTSTALSLFPSSQTIESHNGYIVGGGYRPNTNQSWIQIWDRVIPTTAVTQTIDFGSGKLRVLGNVKGTLFGVVNNFIDSKSSSLGKPSLDIRIWDGGMGVTTTHRISCSDTLENYSTSVYGWQPVSQLKGRLGDSVVFYAKIPITGTNREGIFSLGKNQSGYLTLTQLLDTSYIGDIQNMTTYTNQCVLIDTQNRIWKRNENPNYNVASYYETKIFNAGNSDAKKLLQGVEIMHEPLVAGQTISIYKKVDGETTWTKILENSKEGSISKEELKSSTGYGLGAFKEVKFKIETIGGRSSIHQFSFKYETTTNIV